MFRSENLPVTILGIAFLLFALIGFGFILSVSKSGIKMDAYVCKPLETKVTIREDYAGTTQNFYPDENIYSKNYDAENVCEYQMFDAKYNRTPLKYQSCINVFNNSKERFNQGECQMLGKEIINKPNIQCEYLYVWKTKEPVKMSCEGGTKEERHNLIKEYAK